MPRTLPQLRKKDVGTLHGIGPNKRKALSALEVETVLDLLTLYPRRYIDRTKQATITSVEPGTEATLLVRVRRATARRARSGRPMAEVDVADATGRVRLTFFNQAWRAKQLREGMELAVFGKLETYRGQLQITNPVVDLVGDRTGRIIPVYPQSEKDGGVASWEIAGWVEEALERAGELADPLPPSVRDAVGLVERTWAFRQVHAPDSLESAYTAQHRLKFDELLRLQVLLVQRKRTLERSSLGIRHDVDGPLVPSFIASLPYALTGAQRRAIDEVMADMGGPHPMHRLLQGDVGSGKTVCAVAALLTSVQGGHQGAFLAPTEVLAEQHVVNVRALVDGLTVPTRGASLFGERPVKVELLSGRTSAGDRARVTAGLASGEVDIVVGTHALFTESVAFRDLGAAIVDEQHRFGVEQRDVLRSRGTDGTVPDVLVMTATPIPRTAAMTVYGDLDVTVLDELPPGRTPITTVWAKGETLAEEAAWQQVREEVAAGRQAYVVAPLVEESERVQAKSATAEFERLGTGELAGLRLGLLHGQLSARDKEAAMGAFRRGETQVLVATTVIEVGVDVPNATVMVVVDADRFGIAQLHQLRGRVGRGADRSWCFLLGAATTPEGEERLLALERSTDGFELAEVDLDLRGEGTILGARQKGRNDLKLASLRRDRPLVQRARDVAFELVGDGTGLAALPQLAEEVGDLVGDEEAEYLFKS
ncbi:MAG TPA: ATP-dependent DNA helicase RecG [Acidimicrobiales bacterium]|nr:ATP-dependent DNA helicase RecG [Acidimicrobiales bacterium]